MKKILLTTAAVAALSTSAFAEVSLDNKFYLRADVMGSKLSKINGAKSKYNVGMDIGAGYYFTDSIRAELVFNHAFAPSFKGQDIAIAGTVLGSGKYKVNADALMARAYYDVADLGMAKIFVGVGAGMSRVQAKLTESLTAAGATMATAAATIVAAGVGGGVSQAAFDNARAGLDLVSNFKAPYTPGQSVTVKSKKKNNFAYALPLGASTEFAPGVNGELTYSYRDMGKFKTPKDATSLGSLKGHHVAAGVRFDI